jgi:hypothetical protein
MLETFNPVATVAHTLQGANIIKYSRGKIRILDVDGLKEAACECYDTVRLQHRQLIGPNADQP